MVNFFSHFMITLTAFILILFFSILSFGQDKALQNDLSKAFKKVELVQIGQRSLRDSQDSLNLKIPTANRIVEIELFPRDLRSPQYRAMETGSNGDISIAQASIKTYTGRISGESDSSVRISIDGAKIEGFFTFEGKRFYIEPAGRYSRFAQSDDFVIYNGENLSEHADLYCEDSLIGKIEGAKRVTMNREMPTPQTIRVVEIATEADFELVSTMGSSMLANNEILSLLNMVEGVYENELNLTFTVVYQHTWATSTGFSGADRSAYLNGFKNYWNTNIPTTSVPRDVAYMFSGRSNFMGLGQAFLGTVCASPLSAYAFTGYINSMEANRILMAHEIAHTVGANHAEIAQNCGDTIMNISLNNLTPFNFCSFSLAEVANYVAANGTCLALQVNTPVRFDFDGDRRADVSVFRPSNGVWYVNNSGGGFNIFQFGMSGDKPVSADYDGDGKSDGAVFRNGVWYRLKSSNNTFDAISFGLPDDVPAPADFDGDGKADVVVFRHSNGTWHSLRSFDGSYSAIQFGTSGDVPIAADYDGDGKADINVFRPSNGVWYRMNSSNNSFFAAQFGQNGDRALNGDFDGDRKADLAVWRPSNGAWYSLSSSNGGFIAIGFGLPNDIPVAADYDGDGKTDISVFRPSDGVWHRLSSGSTNAYSAFPFGIGTDLPIPAY